MSKSAARGDQEPPLTLSPVGGRPHTMPADGCREGTAFPLTAWRLISDIRTERALRFGAAYAACLLCFFLWDRPDAHQLQPTPDGGSQDVDTSRLYWSILLVLGAVPIGTNYNIGFYNLMWQVRWSRTRYASFLAECTVYCAGGLPPPSPHIPGCSPLPTVIANFGE